jgi:hypothetical protein
MLYLLREWADIIFSKNPNLIPPGSALPSDSSKQLQLSQGLHLRSSVFMRSYCFPIVIPWRRRSPFLTFKWSRKLVSASLNSELLKGRIGHCDRLLCD